MYLLIQSLSKSLFDPCFPVVHSDVLVICFTTSSWNWWWYIEKIYMLMYAKITRISNRLFRVYCTFQCTVEVHCRFQFNHNVSSHVWITIECLHVHFNFAKNKKMAWAIFDHLTFPFQFFFNLLISHLSRMFLAVIFVIVIPNTPSLFDHGCE